MGYATAAVLAASVTGCAAGSSTFHHGAASSAAPVTCGGLSGAITTLIADQHAQDKALQEGWIMGNDGPDLQNAINVTAPAVGRLDSSQLVQDAATFNADASSYLNDNSISGGGLTVNWGTGYGAIKADIVTLAGDCGIPGAQFNSFPDCIPASNCRPD